jgi:hypothetical protein
MKNNTRSASKSELQGTNSAGGQSPSLGAPVITNGHPSCSITASPATLSWGSATTLHWTTQNVTSAKLEPVVGSVALNGSQGILTLVDNTRYTLRVSGPGGSSTCSVTIRVNAIPSPIINLVDAALLALSPSAPYVAGPIVIDGQSGILVATQNIYNVSGPCVIIRNSNNIRVAYNQLFDCGKYYGGADGVIVKIDNSSGVEIDHNFFTNGGPNSAAIVGYHNSALSIHHNQFFNISGGVMLWYGTSQSVVSNRFQNIRPRAGTPSGFVSMVKASGPYNTIACNTGRNDPAVVQQTGDLINIYESNGTAESPISVYGNRLYATGTNLSGPGLASAGIQTGDGSFSSHIKVFLNQIVDMPAAIGVSGGDTIEVSYNRVSARNRAGLFTSGLAAVNFYGTPNESWTKPGAFCRNVTFKNNLVSMSPDLQDKALMTDWSKINNWVNCENVVVKDNDLHAIIDSSIFNTLPAPGCADW